MEIVKHVSHVSLAKRELPKLLIYSLCKHLGTSSVYSLILSCDWLLVQVLEWEWSLESIYPILDPQIHQASQLSRIRAKARTWNF